MFSLIAVSLLALLIAGGAAVAAGTVTGRGGPEGRFAGALPALVVLLGVLAACLAGWLLAVATAQR